MYYSRVFAKNRTSPNNEDDYIAAYKKRVPNYSYDDYDISAVITNDGRYGHALMHYSHNRSHDNQYHTCYYFVSDDELRNYM